MEHATPTALFHAQHAPLVACAALRATRCPTPPCSACLPACAQRTLESHLWGVPGCINFIDARTKWFDDAVVSAIAGGIKQASAGRVGWGGGGWGGGEEEASRAGCQTAGAGEWGVRCSVDVVGGQRGLQQACEGRGGRGREGGPHPGAKQQGGALGFVPDRMMPLAKSTCNQAGVCMYAGSARCCRTTRRASCRLSAAATNQRPAG